MGSQYGKLNLRDAGKGFLIAFGGAFLPSLASIFTAGALPDKATFLTILGTAVSAGATYVFKNLFTNSENQLLKKEP